MVPLLLGKVGAYKIQAAERERELEFRLFYELCIHT